MIRPSDSAIIPTQLAHSSLATTVIVVVGGG